MSKPRAWQPTFREALKLALRPMLIYLAFNVLGFVAFFIGIVFYDNASDVGLLFASCVAGLFGIVAGQIIALLRVRLWPVMLMSVVSIVVGSILIAAEGGDLPKELAVPLFFFFFALPCGLLSLQHRFELFALFWPSVGWIGGVMIILNSENRVSNWERDKLSAWLPVPLVFLAFFLGFMLLFFAVKQSLRVRLWEALSGALERRVEKKREARATVPRRNTLPLIAILIALFAFTAVLSPYLWRTGKGDRESNHEGKPEDGQSHGGQEERKGRGQGFDGDAVMQMLKEMEESAKHNAKYLLPLLLLLLFYRPLKRALVVSHLKAPIFPSSPSERIENLWEYVRIAAEDAGIQPASADSVEELMKRVAKDRPVPVNMGAAAQIYARSRYGFAIAPGDGRAMKTEALAAARALMLPMSPWQRVRVWWRPLR